ncbi:helix-turn-helix domain-containing protein [Microbacterium sp. 20-116]|uniref:helix-turn-helix domain-containing protein n=1 Tax=Microbacterium sp. 20-116 TaxID=3239883 RepID=UPI0034E1CE16
MARKQRPFTREIGTALLSLRKARKMSQARVSARMGGEGVDMSRQAISRIERGEMDITMGALSAFSRVYRVDVLDVLATAETGWLTVDEPDRVLAHITDRGEDEWLVDTRGLRAQRIHATREQANR